MSSIAFEPAGSMNCPICGGRYSTIELLGVHFACVTACRRALVEDDRIQLLQADDPFRRLILTDSIYLVVCRDKRKKGYDITMRAVSVGGDLVNVATWNRHRPLDARVELAIRRNAS